MSGDKITREEAVKLIQAAAFKPVSELSTDELANRFVDEMIDNLRHNVGEDKRRREATQISRCCK